MRIISLTLEAFGPFLNKQTIDFSKLGKRGICLIHGETGAGKTSIFDGIMYALFGETSGKMRDGKAMRSESADNSIKTFVELVFEYRNNEYTVTRYPTYDRINRNGNITNVSEQAELILPDGTSISNCKEVNEKIRDTIGISATQFRQIALIAQGKFIDLLNAGTKERQDIFRQIFGTEKYQELTKALLQKVSNIKDEIKKLQYNYSLNVSNAQIENSNDYISIEHIDTLIEHLKKTIESDTKNKSEMQSNKADLEQKIANISSLLTEAKSYIETENNIINIQKKIEENQRTVFLAEQNLKNAKNKEIDIEKLKHSIAILGSRTEEYKRLEISKEEYKAVNAKINNLQNVLNNNRNASIALQKEISDNKLEQKSFDDIEARKLEAEHKQSELSKDIDGLTELKHLVEDYDNVATIFNTSKLKYDKAKEAFNKADYILKQMSSDYINGYAYTLAKDLTDGAPCPVCGALEHPNPANSDVEPPSKSEIEKKEKELKTLKSDMEICDKVLGDTRQKAFSFSELIKNKYKAIYKKDFEDYRLAKSDIELDSSKKNAEFSNVTEIIKEINKKIARKAELNSAIPENEDKLNNINNEILELEKEISSLKSRLESIKKIISEKELNLPYPTLAEMNSAISNMQVEKTEYENNIKIAEENKNKLIQEKSILLGQISALQERISGKEKPDIDAINKVEKETRENKEICENAIGVLQNNIATNTACIKNLITIQSKYKIAINDHAAAENLSKVASDNTMDLESFVQTGYFDSILKRANIHLQSMSEGEYSLIREQETRDGRTKFGLNLDVYNHISGKNRSVKTLSGGESFNAALSLALGMSELVQSNAGGIQLNSLFIDEGFGTLDKGSLDTAIKTVAKISTSNRMIYIISHVTELKEFVKDKQIIVKKTGNDREIEILA